MTSFYYLVVGGLVSLLLGGMSLAGNVSSMADLQKHVHQVASRVTAATGSAGFPTGGDGQQA